MIRATKVALGVAGAVAAVGAVVWLWPRATTAAAAKAPPSLVITNLDHGKTFSVHVGDTVAFHFAGISRALLIFRPVAGFVMDQGPVNDVPNNQVVFQGHVVGTGPIALHFDMREPGATTALKQFDYTLNATPKVVMT